MYREIIYNIRTSVWWQLLYLLHQEERTIITNIQSLSYKIICVINLAVLNHAFIWVGIHFISINHLKIRGLVILIPPIVNSLEMSLLRCLGDVSQRGISQNKFISSWDKCLGEIKEASVSLQVQPWSGCKLILLIIQIDSWGPIQRSIYSSNICL